jgi:hypothetical protein
MLKLKLYVVGVSKENPSDTNHNVRIRVFDSDGATTASAMPIVGRGASAGVLGEITLQVADADVQPWKDAGGKFSEEVDFEFPA